MLKILLKYPLDFLIYFGIVLAYFLLESLEIASNLAQATTPTQERKNGFNLGSRLSFSGVVNLGGRYT